MDFLILHGANCGANFNLKKQIRFGLFYMYALSLNSLSSEYKKGRPYFVLAMTVGEVGIV